MFLIDDMLTANIGNRLQSLSDVKFGAEYSATFECSCSAMDVQVVLDHPVLEVKK